MTQPQELRIGNLVFDKKRNRIVTVWGIESNHDKIVVNYANGSGVYSIDLKHIEPIPLTEEWLLKFGFINRGFLEDWFIKLNDDTILILQNHLHYYEVSVCNSNMKKTELNKIKYIHQLQNLYFALKDEELTFKN